MYSRATIGNNISGVHTCQQSIVQYTGFYVSRCNLADFLNFSWFARSKEMKIGADNVNFTSYRDNAYDSRALY